MDEDGELDLTSEPEPWRPPSGRSSGSDGATEDAVWDESPSASGDHAQGGKRVRILFRCCQVDAYMVVPQRVLAGETNVWRVHCVRCGRLVEIPV